MRRATVIQTREHNDSSRSILVRSFGEIDPPTMEIEHELLSLVEGFQRNHQALTSCRELPRSCLHAALRHRQQNICLALA